MLMAAENGSNFWALCMFGVRYVESLGQGRWPTCASLAIGNCGRSTNPAPPQFGLGTWPCCRWFEFLNLEPHGSQSVVLLGDAA